MQIKGNSRERYWRFAERGKFLVEIGDNGIEVADLPWVLNEVWGLVGLR